MTSMFDAFHFLQPMWLLMLLALPPILWIVSRRKPVQAELSRLVDAALLPYLLDGQARTLRWPRWAFALAWTLASVAMAGPSWDRQAQPLFANRAAQVVALSLSQRMLAHDVVPDRVSRARYKIRDLFAANRDGLNGLIAYAGESFVVAPLTSDAHSLDDLLDALAPDTMPVDGDDAARAIEQGVDLIKHADTGGGSLVLVTDAVDDSAMAAAGRARAAGIRVSVLGIGTSQGGPVPLVDGGFLKDASGAVVMSPRDDAALGKLAAAGGGTYVPLNSGRADIDALHAQLGGGSSGTVLSGQKGADWLDRGPWLLLPLLPLLALAFRRGWLLVLAIALLPAWAPQARADGLTDLWRTRDQQAAQALQKGDAKAALQLARDPSLRASAAYKAGDYPAAASAFGKLPGAEAQYNLGNALAKQGEYKEAIAAYDRALKSNPALADAVANRKSVEDFLRQQDQQKQQGKDDKSSKDKKGASSAPGQGDASKDDASKSGKDNEGKDQGEAKNQSGKPGSDGKDGQQDKGNSADAPGTGEQVPPEKENAAKAAEQRAKAAQAEQALKQQVDKALAQKPAGEQPHELGAAAAEDDPQSKLPADVRQALQRVPDDPGGLLRRKFMLEYQRRHGAVTEEQ
jgi:Ca-activated chloride channel family protein